jgi:hypothetical protein
VSPHAFLRALLCIAAPFLSYPGAELEFEKAKSSLNQLEELGVGPDRKFRTATELLIRQPALINISVDLIK